jgi:hypothetical protein
VGIWKKLVGICFVKYKKKLCEKKEEIKRKKKEMKIIDGISNVYKKIVF